MLSVGVMGSQPSKTQRLKEGASGMPPTVESPRNTMSTP